MTVQFMNTYKQQKRPVFCKVEVTHGLACALVYGFVALVIKLLSLTGLATDITII